MQCLAIITLFVYSNMDIHIFRVSTRFMKHSSSHQHWGIVRRFPQQYCPSKRPLTLCLQIYPNDLDHATLLKMVKKRLSNIPNEEQKVESIQYVPRKKITEGRQSKDIWLITVISYQAKCEMLRGLMRDRKMYVVFEYDKLFKQEKRKIHQLDDLTLALMKLKTTV